MANTLTALMPKILARGLTMLRERCILPQIVNNDFSKDAQKKGSTVDVEVPFTLTASDVTPSNAYPTPANVTPSTVQVVLDQWKHSDFHLSDKDMCNVDANASFIPKGMDAAVTALANAVNSSIFGKYTGIYGYYGTAGTTPFGTPTSPVVADATCVRAVLNKQKCPLEPRYGVLNFDAEAAFLGVPSFSDAEKVGLNGTKIKGEAGMKYGIDWMADDAVPYHTAGTAAAGTVTLVSDSSVGDSTVTLKISTGTATLVVGDIFTIAGDTQTYVVTAAATLDTTGVAVSISPTLQVAVDGSGTPVAVTVKASHRVNLVIHRDAFAIAMRSLAEDEITKQVANQLVMRDPLSGLVMRLEILRQYKQTVWDFDILWGVNLIRAECAARLAG